MAFVAADVRRLRAALGFWLLNFDPSLITSAATKMSHGHGEVKDGLADRGI